jgi:hypothetical protein
MRLPKPSAEEGLRGTQYSDATPLDPGMPELCAGQNGGASAGISAWRRRSPGAV